MQLMREMAAEVPQTPAETVDLEPLGAERRAELRGKLLAVLRCLSSAPMPHCQAAFPAALPALRCNERQSSLSIHPKKLI